MMGRRNPGQGQLFYEFRLDGAVPDDHLVRKIRALLDLSWVYAELAPYYSKIGRPSIDPVLMIRMLIIGYVFAIRSERQICREVQVNLAYRWFCELGLEDAIPDHSAFSRARNERFRESDIFRRVFERVVGVCIEAGLVGGEGFAVDASLIEADANRQRSIPGAAWKKQIDPAAASRAVKEYLATLDDAAFGAATAVQPKFVSPSDPAAQWTGALKGPAFYVAVDHERRSRHCWSVGGRRAHAGQVPAPRGGQPLVRLTAASVAGGVRLPWTSKNRTMALAGAGIRGMSTQCP